MITTKLKRFFLTIGLLIVLLFFLKNTFFVYYVAQHNNTALSKIKAENPENYAIFYAFIKEIEEKTDWHVYVTSTYRTPKEQARLKKEDPRNASAGNSKHNFAEAIDIILYQNSVLGQKWILKASSKERWTATKILPIAQKHQLRWGGNFSTYYDPVHFEID